MPPVQKCTGQGPDLVGSVSKTREGKREARSMAKRIGFLWEKMVTMENCIEAERLMAKNKPDNRMARHIGQNAEKYGATLYAKLVDGSYVFHEPKEQMIRDSYKGKTRRLQIPCLEDQAAMQAWLNIATPYIERRNYYFNCGSIPGAGQLRAVKALQKWLGGKKPPKWAGSTDIKKFYETCPHEVVLKGLRRLFKDKRFIAFAKLSMDAMSSTGVGLAIGFPVSHWFANVALMELDFELKRMFPDVKFTRYMDDIAFISRNKRHLRKAIQYLAKRLGDLGMRLKNTLQVYPIRYRGVTFLSYRFFHGFTLLSKLLMFRIARKMRNASKHMTVHMAQGVVSYMGILKHCNSYHFRRDFVYPLVDPKKCRRLISDATKKNLLLRAA